MDDTYASTWTEHVRNTDSRTRIRVEEARLKKATK